MFFETLVPQCYTQKKLHCRNLTIKQHIFIYEYILRMNEKVHKRIFVMAVILYEKTTWQKSVCILWFHSVWKKYNRLPCFDLSYDIESCLTSYLENYNSCKKLLNLVDGIGVTPYLEIVLKGHIMLRLWQLNSIHWFVRTQLIPHDDTNCMQK